MLATPVRRDERGSDDRQGGHHRERLRLRVRRPRVHSLGGARHRADGDEHSGHAVSRGGSQGEVRRRDEKRALDDVRRAGAAREGDTEQSDGGECPDPGRQATVSASDPGERTRLPVAGSKGGRTLTGT